jgi:ion channel
MTAARDRLMSGDEDRFGLVLACIAGAILATAAIGGNAWGRFLYVALMGATVLLTLRTSGPRVRTVAAIVVGAALITAGAALLFGKEPLPAWTVAGLSALLALVAPVAIFRQLASQELVTFQTVLGAICLYLLAGLFFAFVYGALAAVANPDPFFAGRTFGGPIDSVYFSFVTLATIGYGDVTVVTDLGRMLAVTEGLIGQLYLVSVVAVLVSNLGRARKIRQK